MPDMMGPVESAGQQVADAITVAEERLTDRQYRLLLLSLRKHIENRIEAAGDEKGAG